MAEQQNADELEELEDPTIDESAEAIVIDDPAQLAAYAEPGAKYQTLASRLLDDFLTGRPESTRSAYLARLEAFAAFMGHAGAISTALATLLSLQRSSADGMARRWRQAMIDEVKARRLAPGTVNNRLTVIRALTTMAFNGGQMTFKIKVEGIAAGAYKDTRGMAREDIMAMLDAPDLGEPMGRRDAAMLRLYFMCGLRVSEAINANIENYDARARTLQIWGKKRQSYTTIPLPAPVVKSLDHHLSVDRTGAAADQPLFVAFDPVKRELWGVHRLTRQAVGARFKAYAAMTGLDPADVHPHVARHSYVTQLLRAGVSIDKVAKGARHGDIKTTMIYNDNLANEMEELSDLSGSLYGDDEAA